MKYQDASEFKRLLIEVAGMGQVSRILEIGSMEGETLFQWMKVVSAEGKAGTVISVDLVVPQADPRWWDQRLGHDVTWREWARSIGIQFHLLELDSTDPRAARTVRGLVPALDVLFIDGGHDFSTCCQDYQNFAPLVRRGGIIAFHDLGREWPDVRKVWESIKEPGRKLEIVTSPDHYGIGVFYKG